jgi:hypothetical protein
MLGLAPRRDLAGRVTMCRSIQQLRGAQPPATEKEIADAARQYVRKISGYRTPSAVNAATFETAVDEVAAATRRLLDDLVVGPGSKPAAPVQRRLRR